MPDVPRRRKRPAASGMTSPIGVADVELRRIIQELQEGVNTASEVTSTITAVSNAAAVDLSEVEGNIRKLQTGIDDLWRYIRGLRFGSTLRLARIYTVQDDYLVCKLYNEFSDVESSQNVNVAKPFELRKSEFDGKTITYDADGTVTYTYSGRSQRSANYGGGNIYTEKLVPDYAEDVDVRERILVVAGTTDVLVSGSPCLWTDINTSGRGWVRTDWDYGRAILYVVTTEASLPVGTSVALGYTQDTKFLYYRDHAGAWWIISHFKVP